MYLTQGLHRAVQQQPDEVMTIFGARRPDPDWGERVHAVVVLRPGATLTAGELREHAKTLIAGYKAPRSMEIADALPLSGAGKVLKRELRQRYWDGSERQVY